MPVGSWRTGLLRVWRERPGLLLVVFLILNALSGQPTLGASHFPHSDGKLVFLISIPSFVLGSFLTWRVWRGGRISRVLLIISAALGYAYAALRLARMWGPLELWLLAALAAQIALLVSPAVYQRTRRAARPGTVLAAPLAGGRPRAWLVSWSLLVGLLITLVYLGSMDWVTIRGCVQPGVPLPNLPDCIGLAEGYPLRFLFGYQNVPYIDKLALIKDWAQWSLTSASILYAGKVLLRGRAAAAKAGLGPAPGSSSPPAVQEITGG